LRLAHVCLNEKRLGFFRILADMGVPVSYKIRPAPGPEPVGDIIVGPDANLRGVAVAGSVLIQSAIDELPLIAALATQADRPTTVREAADLREKDTDRIAGMVALLRAFGADVQPYDDGLVVRPSRLRAPTSVRLPSDHRLVFAGFVLAALTGGRTELSGVAAANTSYPGFLADAARYLSLKRA
jgi:3-phosphoshikimate 1-carboxyvinyltransferase